MYDELELDLVGDRKTALFFIISDTDATFNFLVSMAYTQLFNLLCERAEASMAWAINLKYRKGAVFCRTLKFSFFCCVDNA